jgi:DNA-binding LacI/PurR family transcriptional regulator
MSVTMSDIARLANVSISTVSRVLNNYPYVDEDTRNLVQQVAAQMQYPLGNLRASTRIVLFLRHAADYYESQQPGEHTLGVENEIVRGVTSVFRSQATQCYLQSISLTTDKPNLEHIQSLGYWGIILLGGRISPQVLDKLNKLQIPYVMAGSHCLPHPVDSVLPDYKTGIQMAVEHLLKRGARRIVLISGPETTASSSIKRDGFALGLVLNGYGFSPEQVITTADFTDECSVAATEAALARFPDLDAIIYGCDDMATAGVHTLKVNGKRIPDDVKVIGFHNYARGKYVDPPLTTVACDLVELGKIAAHRLSMLIDNPDDQTNSPWIVSVPTQLIIRSST